MSETSVVVNKLFSQEELESHRDRWIKIGLATGKTDLEKAKRGVDFIYKQAGLIPPKEIQIFESPLAGFKAAIEIDKDSESVWDQVGDQVRNQIRGQVGSQTCFGNHDADWLFQLSIFKETECVKQLEGLILLAESTGWFWAYEDRIILTDRPSRLIWRDERCIHIEYSDGFTVSKLSALERLADCSE